MKIVLKHHNKNEKLNTDLDLLNLVNHFLKTFLIKYFYEKVLFFIYFKLSKNSIIKNS